MLKLQHTSRDNSTYILSLQLCYSSMEPIETEPQEQIQKNKIQRQHKTIIQNLFEINLLKFRHGTHPKK